MKKESIQFIEYKYSQKEIMEKKSLLYKLQKLDNSIDALVQKEKLKIQRKHNANMNKIMANKKIELKNLDLAKAGKETKKIVKKTNRLKKCDEGRSEYIRSKYKLCYTCGGNKSLGCGHCISRKVRPLRRSENNTRTQCFFKCNAKFSGNGKRTLFENNLKNEGINTERLIITELKTVTHTKPTEIELQEIYNAIINRKKNKRIERID